MARASVFIVQVAIVATLDRDLNDAVAAPRGLTVVCTCVAIKTIAIVACLDTGPNYTITAMRLHAQSTTIVLISILIVAGFRFLHDTVAARGQATCIRTSIGLDSIAVVADFDTRAQQAVSTNVQTTL